MLQLQIFNKIDLLNECEPHIQRDSNGKPFRVWLSAKTGAGIELIQEAVTELLAGTQVVETIMLRPEQAKLRSQLYAKEFVENEQVDESGNYHLQLRLPEAEFTKLKGREGLQSNGAEEVTEEEEDWANPDVTNTVEGPDLAEVSTAKYCVN